MEEKEAVYGSRKSLTELANSIYESTGKSATIISDWSLSEVRPNNKSCFNAKTDWKMECERNRVKQQQSDIQPYTQEPIEYFLTSTGLMPRVNKKYLIPKIDKVIYDIPNNTTIVYFDDGTKEIARVMDGDTFDKEVGVMQCIVKKMYGCRSKWLKDIVNKGVEVKSKKVKGE